MVLSIGAAVYYLAHLGKLPLQGTAVVKAPQSAPLATHALVVEPLLVNLADGDGSSYLRVALILRLIDPPVKKGVKSKEAENKEDASETVAAVRDTTIAVLARQTADGLLAPDGKEKLKAELKSALAKNNGDLKVSDVFFTDFLVQK